jgi:hypothetical protein
MLIEPRSGSLSRIRSSDESICSSLAGLSWKWQLQEPLAAEGGIMPFEYDFSMGFMLAIMAILGMVLLGSLGAALRLGRWHPALIGAAVGALTGVALIEAVPMLV